MVMKIELVDGHIMSKLNWFFTVLVGATDLLEYHNIQSYNKMSDTWSEIFSYFKFNSPNQENNI